MIQYVKDVECESKEGDLKDKLEEHVGDYVDVLTANLIRYTAPGDDAIVVKAVNFDIIT